MITDKTLDEALVELLRTKRALEALRAKRKQEQGLKMCDRCFLAVAIETPACPMCDGVNFSSHCRIDIAQHAAAKRATLDLTRKLADLRSGR